MPSIQLNHLHLKTQDPKQTAQFYVDTLGATIVSEIPGRGYRLNLHGLTINLTTHIADQTREQHYGMEHIAVNTDDIAATLDQLTANGARLLEDRVGGSGNRVCFLEGPDGVQLELIETKG